MLRMIVSRTGQAILSLFATIVFVFFLVRLTGDPAYFLLAPDAPAEDFVRLRQELGLDRSMLVQFSTYVGSVMQGDLGYSYRLDIPVTEMVARRLPATLAMGLSAILFTIVIAVPLGTYAAYHRNGIVDRIAKFIAALGQATPSFWVGLVLILVFAINLGWLPSGGYGGLQHLVLPALALSFEPIARLTRLLRSGMIEELGSDHVKVLRIKGMSERIIVWKHALRNAGLTTLTFVGLMTAGILTGSVLVETVFIWPGVGRLLVESIYYRDFIVVQGIVLLIAAAYIIINLIVDLLHMLLNPRLRVAGAH
jgi:ABC-type dipeptide/oligopeptide/nickel transport system permease component